MTVDLRHETLIAQHIDVALVYKDMLGVDEARAYLQRENVPREIVQRVLFTNEKRGAQAMRGAYSRSAASLHVGCRRRNHIHHAIVEAALKIESTCGPAWALALLRDERVPETVSARVLAEGPRQVRAKESVESRRFAGILAVR